MMSEVPQIGDVVKLGASAREKHSVLAVYPDGFVTVRQASTGAIRRVRMNRCIVYFREGVIERGTRFV